MEGILKLPIFCIPFSIITDLAYARISSSDTSLIILILLVQYLSSFSIISPSKVSISNTLESNR